MSKRYGRNQKRAHRFQIEAMKIGAEMQTALLGSMRGQLNRYEETIDTVVRVLGRHFFGLPAVRMEVDNIREVYRMPSMTDTVAFSQFDLRSKPELVRYAINELEVTLCSADLDHLRDTVHVMLRNRDGKCGYALSRSALDQARGRDVLPYFIEMIAREMSEVFVRAKR